ncbi:spore germination protein [Paenibacillus alginolyticus]|uniref:Spore germination protein n=1 Tax=Paenibacillus alginolyticus TaxID=59839 RepID=A0ABT4GGZ9_9BACL|nr:spore germination protein [Paenibacillus alginolyticus]MCY9695349.1 spore germination protein [Paenibacillus alginolyticus]MEC0144758.1 spore germination protein [Paenibacillus alginolyticus]
MELRQEPISTSVSQNLAKIQQYFSQNDYLVVRNITKNDGQLLASIIYMNILVDETILNQQIIRKMSEDFLYLKGQADEAITSSLYSLGAVRLLPHLDTVVSTITDAGFVIFVEGRSESYGMMLPGYETRAIEEPKLEPNVRGPREGFTEDLQTNLGMVYRRLKTSELKSKSYIIGRRSQTKVSVLYLDTQVDHAVLEKLMSRLDAIDLNVLGDSAQIEEWIQDNTFSPFPQILNTERPDRIVTALNRGKIAIITDGTPIALIAPSSFFEMMHPSEDLYERFYFANFLRLIRLITLFTSLFGPSLYIALTTFHLEMIPTPLMMAFLSAKAGIPFPSFIEAFIMEVAFEVLREASLRLPRAVGQSVSIVGALIIGEAAVQSGIVSRPVVIVVAMTGIASFTIPSFSTAIALRMLRFPLMLLAASTGVFGLSLGLFTILLHLCSLRFCGVPFLEPVDSESLKNTCKKFILLPARYRSSSSYKKK